MWLERYNSSYWNVELNILLCSFDFHKHQTATDCNNHYIQAVGATGWNLKVMLHNIGKPWVMWWACRMLRWLWLTINTRILNKWVSWLCRRWKREYFQWFRPNNMFLSRGAHLADIFSTDQLSWDSPCPKTFSFPSVCLKLLTVTDLSH